MPHFLTQELFIQKALSVIWVSFSSKNMSQRLDVARMTVVGDDVEPLRGMS